MHRTVIGIDCATDPKKVGLARADRADGGACLTVAVWTKTGSDLVAQVAAWLRVSKPALIALAAPLGWPAPLGTALASHRAGEALDGDSSVLFNRATDRYIHQVIGKKPLEVGADRIARTAVSALHLLQQVREETGLALPLARQPGPLDQSAAIEVYPAATLKALGLPYTRYKRRNDVETAIRHEIIDWLHTKFDFDQESARRMATSGDCLDAALCCQAGLDFLHGNVLLPKDEPNLTTEGWIWVRPPLATINDADGISFPLVEGVDS